MINDKYLRHMTRREALEIVRRSGSSLVMTQRLAARGVAVLTGAVALATVLGAFNRPNPLDGRAAYAGTMELVRSGALEQALDSSNAHLELATRELERARSLIQYSARFNIAADLAASIYDMAVVVGLDPELAFRVVYVESTFNPRALSPAGAVGLAQVMPSTAQFYRPGITRAELYDRDLNLEIGFRHLHYLIERFDGDLASALIAYNRGPTRLMNLLDEGVDPRNGYASSVLDGYGENPGESP